MVVFREKEVGRALNGLGKETTGKFFIDRDAFFKVGIHDGTSRRD